MLDAYPFFLISSNKAGNMKRFILYAIYTLLLVPIGSHATEPSVTEQQTSVVKSEDVIGKLLENYKLIDQDGIGFNTSELSGRPLVVSFIYTSCIHICPTITLSISNVIKEKKEGFGRDYNILTVSFDPDKDTPRKLKEFGANFTSDFKHWRFATADKETIDRMTRNFGFFYKKDGETFQHINMVSVLDANSHILTHVYGIDFKPDQVLNPIYNPDTFKKNQNSGLAALVKKVSLFCYKYDPATNSYRLDYPLLVQMTLEGTLLFSILFFVWKKEITGFFSTSGRKKINSN